MKKIMALLLTLVLCTSMLTGCGDDKGGAGAESAKSAVDAGDKASPDSVAADTDKGASDTELKSFVLASQLPDTGSPSSVQSGYNIELMAGLAGGTVTFPAALDFTPDGTITFVESQIAAGADGLFLCPPAESVLPTITQLCDEAGVYWGITLRTIEDEEIRKMVEGSEYYVGNCYENEEDTGYQVMKELNDMGYKKVAIITQPVGDKAGDRREVGIKQACEEFGMEVVAEARGMSQAADCASATESFLAANPDLDVIFCVALGVAGGQEAVAKAITDSGREVKVATIDWPIEMVRLFEEGTLVVAASSSGPAFGMDQFFTAAKVINAIQGYPIEDGKPFSNTFQPYSVNNLDAAKEVSDIANNESYKYYEEDIIANTFFKWNNPELSQATMQTLIEEYSIK